MNTALDWRVSQAYKNPTQQARVVTERWVAQNAYCPSCGHTGLRRYANNRPVADFFCPACKEDYELKSHRNGFGATVVNGASDAMMARLGSNDNPNLLLLSYERSTVSVLEFLAIPKYFFVPSLIEQRKPLASTARRAGWVGCTIRLSKIPTLGRIYLIRNGVAEPRPSVMTAWRNTTFLREAHDATARDWLMNVIACIEKLRSQTFTLEELYAFETELRLRFPNNRHIKAKIRQQLQVLRDRGYLAFIGRGQYRLA
jgi:type II restriction enzyme